VYELAADDLAQRMQAKLDLRSDAEVAAPAAQPPQQLGVAAGARPDHAAVRGDELGGDQVVAGETELCGEMADAAAEGEPGDARRAHHAAGGHEAGRLSGGVEVQPGRAALGCGDPPLGIHRDSTHQREVDHQAAVAHAVARRVVAAAAHGDLETA
jgi:hypothetical protein